MPLNRRVPLGDDTHDVGSSDFTANGGTVEFGPAMGAVGVHSEGSRAWAASGLPGVMAWRGDREVWPNDPPFPQVYPVMVEPNYALAFPDNGARDAFHGIDGDEPYTVIGFFPEDL